MLASRRSRAFVQQHITIGHCLLVISSYHYLLHSASASQLHSVASKYSSPSTSNEFQVGQMRDKDAGVVWVRTDTQERIERIQQIGDLGVPPPEVESRIKPAEGRRRKLPDAIIIGVKKGGTRALLEFIKVHPDIRAPGPEVHFFDRQYRKGLDWYRSRMPVTLEGQVTVEKTPSYLVTRSVPRRVYSMSPDVRLIVVVRDPVTRALSDYTQTRLKRPELPSFEVMAFSNVSERHRRRHEDDVAVNISWGAVRIGLYERYLSRWLRFFSIDRFHFVNGERLVADPAGELGRLQDFLGVKRLVTDKHFYYNATKGFPCLKKSENSGAPRCLGQSKGRSHPVVSTTALQRLRNFYQPYNHRFYDLTGVDFGWD